MELLGWLKGHRPSAEHRRLAAWRTEWAEAVAAEDGERSERLECSLAALGLPEDDLEIEREMLAGLSALADTAARLREGQLPVLETGHRVVGTEICHFSVPASVPNDPAQSSGRLILTGQRAIFAGGGRAVTTAWQLVAEVLQTERDILLVLHDRETAHRYRCNAFAAALCGAALSRYLSRRARPRPAGL